MKNYELKTKITLALVLSIIIIACTGDPPKVTDRNPVAIVEQDTIVEPLFMSKTPKEGLWEALLYYEVHHPEIVYAQAILESQLGESKLYSRTNNLFGLYNSRTKQYFTFDHWIESVLFYKKVIQDKYEPPNNYYSFLESLPYATDPTYTNKLQLIVKKHGKIKQISSKSYHQYDRQESGCL
jgi:hypothetical protein